MRVAISQPMYFPWVGFLEQIRLCDVFVRYDDVQFSKGSFTNRVQIKTNNGPHWLTIPLKKFAIGTPIREIFANEENGWRRIHIEKIRQNYKKCTYYNDVIALVERVLFKKETSIDKIAWSSIDELCAYFNLHEGKTFLDIDELKVGGHGSDRVLEIVNHLGGDIYITGHGARNYLDHEKFESMSISVEYMDYKCMHYPQQHGEFTPYVSALDLIANCGRDGREYICSGSQAWRSFVS